VPSTPPRRPQRPHLVVQAFRWLLLVAGGYAGVRLAFPVQAAGARCPLPGAEGYGACVVQKSYAPAVVEVVLAVAAGYVVAMALTATLPRIARRLLRRPGAAPVRRRGDGTRRAVARTARGPRVTTGLSVAVSRAGDPVPRVTTTVNASLSGLLLAADAGTFALGEALTLLIGTGERPIAATGRVVRRTRAGEHGIELEGLDGLGRARLATLLAEPAARRSVVAV